MKSHDPGTMKAAGTLFFLGLLLPMCSLFILPVQGFAAAKERQEVGLMRQGIDHYQNSNLDQARQAFENAELECRDACAVIYYYLGLIDLQKQDRSDAILQWQKFATLAPEYDYTPTIRKFITLLKYKEAEAFAHGSTEAALKTRSIGNRVAVIPFENLNASTQLPLGKGLTALMTEDLSLFESLEVVPRQKVQAMLKATGFATFGLMDKNRAVKVGRRLAARHVVYGTFTVVADKRLKLMIFMVDTETNDAIHPFKIRDKLDNISDLTKKSACRIAATLNHNCDDVSKAFRPVDTPNPAALTAFSQGLAYMDNADYMEAQTLFESALDEDADFELAQRALAETPTLAMRSLSETRMIAEAGANAPDVADFTNIASSVNRPKTVKENDDKGSGLGTYLAIGGGVLAAGGVAAIALAGGEKPSSEPDHGLVIEGQWRGAWVSEGGGGRGEMVLILSQNNTTLSGRTTLIGSDCGQDADASGTLNGGRVRLNLTGNDFDADLDAQADLNAGKMEGTLMLSRGDCTGVQMSISLVKTGGIGVTW